MRGYIVNYTLYFKNKKDFAKYCESILLGLTKEELENTDFYLEHLGVWRNAWYSGVRILKGLGYSVLVIE